MGKGDVCGLKSEHEHDEANGILISQGMIKEDSCAESLLDMFSLVVFKVQIRRQCRMKKGCVR
jgi:hypothetical protein